MFSHDGSSGWPGYRVNDGLTSVSNWQWRPRLIPALEGGSMSWLEDITCIKRALHVYRRGVLEEGMLSCQALGETGSMEASYTLLWDFPKFQNGEWK